MAARKGNAAEIQTDDDLGGAPPPAPGSLEIDIDDPPDNDDADDDDDDDDEPSQTRQTDPEPKPKKKSRDRTRNYKAVTEQLEQERQARQSLENRLSQLTGFVAGQHRQQEPQDPTAALQAELDAVFDEQDGLVRQAQAGGAQLTEAQWKDINKRARALETKKLEIVSRKQRILEAQNQPDTTRQTQEQVFRANLVQRYPDFAVQGMERQAQAGWLRAQQLALKAGVPLNWEILDEAAEQTRQEYGMPSRRSREPAPTQREKSRLEGSPSGGKTNGSGEDKSGKVRLSKEQIAMAKAAFPEIARKDVPAACRRWWKEFGSKA